MKSSIHSLEAPVRILVAVLLLSNVFLTSTLAASGSAVQAMHRQPAGALSGAPLFVQNVGQFADSVRFQVWGAQGPVWLTDDGLWLTALQKSGEGVEGGATDVHLTFVDANTQSRLEPFDRQAAHFAYLHDPDPAGWNLDVPVWGGVQVRDLYPGIDLVFTGQDGQVAAAYVAEPGADLDAVQIRLEGADGRELTAGDLDLAGSLGDGQLQLLAALSLPADRSNARSATPSTTTLHPAAQAANLPLPELVFSTFLGGGGVDENYDIAVDEEGNVTLAGKTDSSNFPATAGSFHADWASNPCAPSTCSDGYVAKLSADGSRLEYALFLGGTHHDEAHSVALDGEGNAYVVGLTQSTDFPTTPGSLHPSATRGDFTCFLLKVSPDGRLLYSTYLIGMGTASGVSVDGEGSAYVTGTAYATLPATQGAFSPAFNGGRSDAYVAKVSPDGRSLEYATYLGGSGDDKGYDIAVDATGNAWVAGETVSYDFPATAGAFDTEYGGGTYTADNLPCHDGFLAKLTADGRRLEYATYLGGQNSEAATGVAVGRDGSAYVVGGEGPGTGFALKFGPGGVGLSYAVRTGWGALDIALDRADNAYILIGGFVTTAGSVGAIQLPFQGQDWDNASQQMEGLTYEYPDLGLSGRGQDVNLIALNDDATRVIAAASLGGGEADCQYGCAVAVGADGDVTIAGDTASRDFPTTAQAFQTSYAYGWHDAFVLKWKIPRAQPPQILSPAAETRIMRCEVDVSGTAEPGATLHLWTTDRLPASAGPDVLPIISVAQEIGTATVADDGTWTVGGATLLEGDNHLYATLELEGQQSEASDYTHVLCRKPQVVYVNPPDAMSPVYYDLSASSAIAFRFDVPMDETSINSQTVWLTSDVLELVHGTVTHEPPVADEEPTYVFHPEGLLQQASLYTATLSADIRAAVPNQDIHIDPYTWPVATTGVPRERVIQAIRDLTDRACEKIEWDTASVARAYSDVHGLEESLGGFEVVKGLIALVGAIVKGPKNLSEAIDTLKTKGFTSKEGLLHTASVVVDAYWTGSDILAGLTEEDWGQVQQALEEGTVGNMVYSQIELLLRGAGSSSPLSVPIKSGPDGQTIRYTEGTGAIIRSIRQQAENLISMLPDPLPPQFPTDELYWELKGLEWSLGRSTMEPVWVRYTDYRLQNSETEPGLVLRQLGQLAFQQDLARGLMEAIPRRNLVQGVVTGVEGVSVLVSLAARLDPTGAALLTEWYFEPVDALVNLYSTSLLFLADPYDLLLQVPHAMLSLLAVEASETHLTMSEVFESILALSQPAQARSSGQGLQRWLAALTPPSAFAAEGASVAYPTVVSTNLTDVVVEPAQHAGRALGAVSVLNPDSKPWRVRARVQLVPVGGPGDSYPTVGQGWSPDWLTLEPGATAALTVDLAALGPGITGQIDLQALVELDAVPSSGGWPRTVGPFSQILRVGTRDQLDAVSPLRADTVLSGELALGEIQTTTLSLDPSAQRAILLVRHSPQVTLALSLQDQAGNRLTVAGDGQPALGEGLAASHLSGSGHQTIVLDPIPAGALQLEVRGVTSRRGRGLAYDVTAIQQQDRPAALAAFPPEIALTSQERTIPLALSVIELGGRRRVVDMRGGLVGPSQGGDSLQTPWLSLSASAGEIPAGGVVGLWGEIRLPSEAAAGLYTGSLQVKGTDAVSGQPVSQDVPVTIRFEPEQDDAAEAGQLETDQEPTERSQPAEPPQASSPNITVPLLVAGIVLGVAALLFALLIRRWRRRA